MLSVHSSRVAQWERAGPITQRSMDRNHPLLFFFLTTINQAFFFLYVFVLIMELPFSRRTLAIIKKDAKALDGTQVRVASI